jgi:hypothetical protein
VHEYHGVEYAPEVRVDEQFELVIYIYAHIGPLVRVGASVLSEYIRGSVQVFTRHVGYPEAVYYEFLESVAPHISRVERTDLIYKRAQDFPDRRDDFFRVHSVGYYT